MKHVPPASRDAEAMVDTGGEAERPPCHVYNQSVPGPNGIPAVMVFRLSPQWVAHSRR